MSHDSPAVGAATTPLGELLPRQAATHPTGASPTVIVALPRTTRAALDARARRLGLPVLQLGRAALALVEVHLTGNAAAGEDDGNALRVPATGALDAWLAGATGLDHAAALAAGAWGVDARAADAALAGTPFAWWLDEAALHGRARDAADAGALQVLATALANVLTGLADATSLEEVSPLDATTRQRLLCDWNATAVARQPGDSVHALFTEVATRWPERIAIVDGDVHIDYATLDRRAHAIAAALAARGTAPGTVVGVLLDRSADALAVLLGILHAGAAYLPLDRSHPAERIVAILADAAAPLAIGYRDDPAAKACAATHWLAVEELGATAAAATLPGVASDAPAYVMYTSGSTGTPKGVVVPHRAIIRLVREVRYVEFGEAPRVLHAAPLGFDAATFEIWGALLNGGTVVAHRETIPSGRALAATIAHGDARVAWLTAALFNAIVDDDPQYLAGLGQLLIGGEALSVPHVRKALAALPGTTLINGYGPTECTTFAATWAIPRDLAPDATSVPIGRPIANTCLYVLNARGELVPPGVLGELHIGGAGVALGYLGRPDLTAERFLPDPFAPAPARLYRTGDQVRWREDGTVEFVGRSDGQVKIRGFRIETGEIEAALKRHPAVRDAAVLAREDQPGHKRLVAYYVENAAVAPTTLRAALARTLPEFMVPALYLRLDQLPVTANGKLDRRALPAPDRRRPELASAYAPPRGETEHRIAAVFADLTGIDRVGRDDNFFELGGDSLLALKAIASIDAGPALSIACFFAAPRVAAIAALLDRADEPTARRPRPRQPPRRDTGNDEPIAIIGMAGRFPGAADVETFWRNLCEGRDSIRHFAPDELDPAIPAAQRDDPAYVPARGVLEDVAGFDAAFFGITPREADLMDPQQRIFLELCWECCERAGVVPGAGAPVGVFAGMYNATYFQRHVSTRPDLIAKFGAFQVMLDNEKDYIATRIAHKLDFTGPAISIHTACSTSLVAICQAVDALRGGHCEMALAGGVAVTCPPASGYLYQEGGMLSPDGHTRSFAADAQGTVFSDGAAVLLLKPLSRALADGNPVHALIRGGAVNNDGGGKASFTAPSSSGQASVIERALDAAGVDARSISYVETHGTATPLGDPIEIEGLTTAFRRNTDATGFCAIGSVKSNIGHTVIAAGATGVIKTALALAERRLPPTLHVTTTNPAIDFVHSPFVPNRELRDWRSNDGAPLRAGVSSFGVGGTNAHVVMEEAPPRPAPETSAGPHLLLLSARTPTALMAARARLARHLAAHPDDNLADVAWTLAAGRKALALRSAVVAADSDAAVAALDAAAAPQPAQPGSGIVFMFPGQGAQYAGMGRALHAAEPVFRDALDTCAEGLAGMLGFDLRERLFADDAEALRETALTQPATFAIEYALAQLWLDAGLRPDALVGHSIGEFVAAVLAGVMSLEDGLYLIALRGRLMQALPAGAMLSVRLDAQTLAARLSPPLSLAVENAPDACVVAGPMAAVETLRIALEADAIACRRLQTSHAFHSAMMDPVVAPLRAETTRLALAPPTIPIISTRTGRLLADDEATSPDHWARHARDGVRFAQALATLHARAPDALLLEVGPRATLTRLARQQPARPRAVVASLGDQVAGEVLAWRQAAGAAWCAGAALDFTRLDRRTRRQRLCLPGYPFEHARHWIDAPTAAVAPAATNAPPPLPSSLPEPAMSIASPASGTSSGQPRLARIRSELATLVEDVAGIEVGADQAEADFVALGLDSLALTQLALQAAKAFDIKLTFRQLMEDLGSPERLAMHIDQTLPPDAATAMPAAPAAPQPTPAPVAQAAPAPPGTSGDGLLRQVIAQQMALMQQQLTLLAGAAPGVPAPATPQPALPSADTPPAPVAPPTPPAAAASDEEAALAHTRYDVNKAFGAIARIHAGHSEPDERQHLRLDAFMRRYLERTRKSREYTERHRPHLADPRVVTGFRPQLKEITYQIVVERSQGAHLWDIDGNEYVDALNGFGMNLFGWQPPFVLEAVRHQLASGYEIGPQHPLAGEVAERICELTGFDRAALCNTGSEAVMGTVRIARTVTGRETLVIFSGAYHGIFDEVIVRGTKKLRSVPAAPGILRNTAEHVLVLDYGDPASLDIIRERAHEIAAVLVEPVQSRRPDLQPREFLHDLRRITAAAGCLLIFDEVVTGFRSHPRGAQQVFGVDADLASYGKVVGGGMPIGVIAGKREFMDALDGGQWRFGDDSVPTVGVTYFAGTFVRHPLALAAARAVLDHLKQAGPALQERLNARTAAFADDLNAACREAGAPLAVTHFASLWRIGFSEDHPLQDLLFAMMRSRGIHILDHFPCFFTTAHAEQDYVAIVTAFKDSLAEMQASGFLPRRIAATQALDADRPPLPGARLGRDADGNPAWFVPNPDQPGKYRRIDA